MEQLHNVNIVDLSVLIILVLSGILALIRGLVRELVVLGVWIGSVLITAMAYPMAKPFAEQYIKNEMGADAASALGVFCVSLIVLIPLGHLISSLIKGETITAIDRSLGFVFGILRGLLVVSLFYLGASWLWPNVDNQPEWLQKARARPLLAYGADIIRAVVPEEKLSKVEKDVQSGKETAEKAADQVEQLDKLVPPVPAAKPEQAPAYAPESRDNLERLIMEKGKK